MQATWHKGHSLAQTVFSCIYLLRLERTSSHALLYSYCRVTRATCNAVVSAVSESRTHEVMCSNYSFGLMLFIGINMFTLIVCPRYASYLVII